MTITPLHDQIFKTKKALIKPFEFNDEVAAVFDDMLSRSIPFYHDIHKVILDILDKSYQKTGVIYDLGCSTGTTLRLIHKHLMCQNLNAKLIGIDNSSSMINKCRQGLIEDLVVGIDLICDDIENVELLAAQMVIMNYTLQFIPRDRRLGLVKKIYDSLNTGGVFIFSEKIVSSNTSVNDLLTDLYYDFKRRNGYSELEISQKREALENVLIPLTAEEQMELLQKAGFVKCEVLFRWYNFACFIGIK
ncbi:MAG: carboxy-S-adenosyl-L-methionine synthase CmoA [Bacteriovoracaceae bacterium]|nr:carboxy-S-adenosyl-L-methionine synthase CmoA [Bacteriovoracaceae bacterium]